ncbi:MAG: YraN family protein [Candidatus Paceibacterota bacterium]|jgi:putative endonuclease
MPTTKETGRLGEQLAKKYLESNGYEILDQNYIFRIPGRGLAGEIDIIAKKNGAVSFVEVKTLYMEDTTFGGKAIRPEDKVNAAKQRKLIKSAESWLSREKIGLESSWQIDIIAVEIYPGHNKINHFQNAIASC